MIISMHAEHFQNNVKSLNLHWSVFWKSIYSLKELLKVIHIQSKNEKKRKWRYFGKVYLKKTLVSYLRKIIKFSVILVQTYQLIYKNSSNHELNTTKDTVSKEQTE